MQNLRPQSNHDVLYFEEIVHYKELDKFFEKVNLMPTPNAFAIMQERIRKDEQKVTVLEQEIRTLYGVLERCKEFIAIDLPKALNKPIEVPAQK